MSQAEGDRRAVAPVTERQRPNLAASAKDLAGISDTLLSLATEVETDSLATRATEQMRQLLGADRVLLTRQVTDDLGLVANESVAVGLKRLSNLHCELKYLFPLDPMPPNSQKGQVLWLPSVNHGRFLQNCPDSGLPAPGPQNARAANPFHLHLAHSLGHQAVLHWFVPSKRNIPALLSCYFNQAPGLEARDCEDFTKLVRWFFARLEELAKIQTRGLEARLRSVRLAVRSEAPEKYSDVCKHFNAIAPSLYAHSKTEGLSLAGPKCTESLGKRLSQPKQKLLCKWLEHQNPKQNTAIVCQGSRQLDKFWPQWAENILAAPIGSGLHRMWLIFFKSDLEASLLRPWNQCHVEHKRASRSIGRIDPFKNPIVWPDAMLEHCIESADFLSNTRAIRQRLRAERRLRLSEARREAIIASIPEIITIVDMDCQCVDIHVPTGFTHPLINKDYLDRRFDQSLPQKYLGEFREKFEAVLNEGESQRIRISLDELESPLHYELSLALCGTSEVIISIREQTKLIESLKRNKLLSLVAKKTKSAIIVTSPDKTIRWINTAFEKLSGYSEAEVLGRKPELLQGEQTDPWTIERIRQRLAEELTVRESILNYRKDGSPYWTRLEISPYYKKDGSLDGFIGVQLDITELVDQREQLKSKQEELSLLYDHSPVGLLLKDGDGRWLRANQEFLRQVGLANYPWAGKTNMEISKDYPDLNPLLESCRLSDAQTWQQQHPLVFEEKITLPTQEDLFFEVRKCPLYDAEGKSRGIILVSQDITQRKQTEKRNLQSAKRKAIEQMAGGIAHDFNNFLASIGMSAELLLQDQSLPTKTQDLVQSIQRKAQAANYVARQLLAFTKQQPLHAEPVDLENLLEECMTIALSGSATQYSLKFENQPFSFPTDPNLLLQVLTNLILNARQAQKNKGSVSITAGRTKDGRLRISVADEGPGIPPGEADSIFAAYYSTKESGSGLGLHVVSTIVSRLKGTIELDRTHQSGARFILKIPPAEITEATQELTDSTETSAPGLDPPKAQILLLEDDSGQVDLLTTFFESLGLEYDCFSDGALLCEHVQKMKETDREQLCCLLDITVTTGLGALDILSSLRKAAPRARIILISGYTDQWESNYKLLKESNATFLPKPYSLADLEKKITKSG